MIKVSELLKQHSHPVEQGLNEMQIRDYLASLDSWKLVDNSIEKTYSFKNYHETMAFVNAMAYIIHAEDHHPELVVSYNKCVVRFNTHSVNAGRGGISENDFICAAKIDALPGLQ